MTRTSDVVVRQADDLDDLDELNVGNPAWSSAALVRQLLTSVAGEGAPCGALVAEIGGEPVGYAGYFAIPVLDGRRAPVGLYVHPAYRRRGVGSALWAAVTQACTSDHVRGIMTSADADDTTSVDIALAHGCRLGALHIESELDLVELEERALRGFAATPDGLSLAPLPRDADEPMWRDLAAVYDRLEADTPDVAAGFEPTPYPILRTFLAEPWQVMAAWKGRDIVGFTSVAVRDAAARTLNTNMTGVLADYRGKGIATALKAAHALALRQAGWLAITTQNMDTNAPILAANRTLGFTPRFRIRDLTFDHDDPEA
jgi:GNAT superfamily N-acetyltransferase